VAIGKPIRRDGHFAFLSDQGAQNALEHRNPGRRPPEKCDKASAFLTEKLTRRDCKLTLNWDLLTSTACMDKGAPTSMNRVNRPPGQP